MNIDTPTHFENDFVKAIHLPDKNIVIFSYKGFTEDHVIKTGALKLINIAKCNNSPSIVFDNTKFEGATPKMHLWVKNNFFKLAYEGGVINFAIVVPENVYAVFSIESAINEDMKEFVNIEKFESPEKAIEWIIESKP